MPKKGKKALDAPGQADIFDITLKLKTAVCVPALREAVKAWRVGGYKGVTDTTHSLLSYWFETDHRLKNGSPFRYHSSQREAIETLIFVWECEKVRTRKALLERYASSTSNLRLPLYDDFPRYCTKMATGSGKTKVMALAVVWQFMNAACENVEIAKSYAKTFLVIAPNVIVYERLKTDFGGRRIFHEDPLIPRTHEIFWDFDCVMRGDGEKAHAEGTLFLTNIQQLYERPDRGAKKEPEAMTAVLGPTPPAEKLEMSNFQHRIALRAGALLVINDEAHHTHDEESEWNRVMRGLHEKTPIAAQLDFSATPRFQKGGLFPWTISDFPLKQAILECIVKRPLKGIADIQEARSDIASVRYKGFLAAGVERWKEYREQLKPLSKKPVLFIMLNNTDEADDVGDWLRTKYPEEFGGERTLIIHTDTKGNISEAMVEKARDVARKVDEDQNPVNAIVSVLMLREGWDVQNVTVVVGLRPYKAKAQILPEQTIGRGLRLMFRGQATGYRERVDVIGNRAFLQFVNELERIEEIKLDTFEIGKDKLRIIAIGPEEGRKAFDIGLPVLSPVLVRKKSLADEIAALDVCAFANPPLPIKQDDKAAHNFRYDGYDIITLEKEVEREYKVPEPQTPQEVIGYYARRIAQEVKLPAQFAALAPKVREFFERQAFGKVVDLETPAILKAMSSNIAHFVCVQSFKKALSAKTIEEQEPKLLMADRMLSSVRPFPWSRPVFEASKCVLNLVPCDNDFEREFAKFLDAAEDVEAFSKLPEPFGFAIEYTDAQMNLRHYYPDFVALATDGTHWLLETKGQEGVEVAYKSSAAKTWCENATTLTGKRWRYLKVPQRPFEELEACTLSDVAVLDA